MRGQITAVVASIAYFGLAAASSDRLIASSGSNHVQLLELFSSESCSSCPPADRWVSELQSKPGLWKSYVPVVFHVDYWNHLGWKDDFSTKQMTKRQVDISNAWGQDGRVYTPAFVRDGKEWRDWRAVGNLPEADSKTAKPITLTIYKRPDGAVRVQVSGLETSRTYLLRVALLGMNIRTRVRGGENSGRDLEHNFLVLDWNSKPLTSKTDNENFYFKESSPKTTRFALAAWVEESGNPAPLQAVGGYL